MMMMMMMMALYKTNQLDSSMDLPDLMTMMDTLQWLKEINDNDYLEIITIDAVNVIIYGQLFGHVILIVNVFFFRYKTDKQMRVIRTSSLITLSNLMEPLSSITRDILRICHYFRIDNHTIISYSIELFDRFFENILDLAISKSLIWLGNESIDLTERVDFGSKLKMLIDSGECFDYLYLIIFGLDIPMNIRDLYGRNDYRTLCIAICVLIASKLHGERSSFSSANIIHLMERINAPAEFCTRNNINSIEVNILNLINFDPNIITLNIFVETLLSITIRYIQMNYPEDYRSINIDHLVKISQLITQNYYISRFEIFCDLFRNEYKMEFQIVVLEHIISLQNLYRDKMLIASGIVSSLFHLKPLETFQHEELLHFLSNMTTIPIDRIGQCRDVLIQRNC